MLIRIIKSVKNTKIKNFAVFRHFSPVFAVFRPKKVIRKAKNREKQRKVFRLIKHLTNPAFNKKIQKTEKKNEKVTKK